MNYVVGFAFNKDKTKVLLIKKTKPAWQSGFFNGIGGKIEHEDKNPSSAMIREFQEESNIQTTEDSWHYFAKLHSDYFELHCFVGFFDENFLQTYQDMTEEKISLIDVQSLFNQQFSSCITNVGWLISLCLDPDIYHLFINSVCKTSS